MQASVYLFLQHLYREEDLIGVIVSGSNTWTVLQGAHLEFLARQLKKNYNGHRQTAKQYKIAKN